MACMSQAAAIAAVTLALKMQLESAFKTNGGHDRHLGDVLVTTLPVDRARSVHHRSQVNLTLATVHGNASRSQTALGLRARPQPAEPSHTVDLVYLLTAYGPEDDEVMAQRVMGVAMRALHERPMLEPIDLAVAFPHSGAAGTLERLEIAQAPLTREQIVAWWLAFHTPYRLSAVWQVSGVRIG